MQVRLKRCLGLLMVAALAACTTVNDFMPREIQNAEKPSIEGAKALLSKHPEASRSYVANGRVIHYFALAQETPPRPLVIFVHGSPGLWRTWAAYLSDPELQSKANLIAMDRPGFGGSGSGRIERGLRAQSEALAPLLAHVQPGQRVILVGHAYGAAIAVRMAMAYPDRITDLVLTGVPLDPALQTESWFQYVADYPPITWLLPKEIRVFNREYLGLEKELTDMLPLWPRITQHVSLLLGEQDEEVPIETAVFARKMLTQARSVNIVQIAHVNHFIPWTQFDLVKAEILAHTR